MEKPDYQEFDGALMAYIDAGRNTMLMLDCAASGLARLADQHRKEGKTPLFRVIDRRLQALRKAGKIIFTRNGWQIVE